MWGRDANRGAGRTGAAHAGHNHDLKAHSHHHGHSHDHGHRHDHGAGGHHHHAPSRFGAAFAIAIALNVLIVVTQAIVGVLAHSVALIADAGHNLSDVLGLCLAFAAGRLAMAKPTPRFTYGFGASSILAALANAVFLLLVTGGLSWEAIQRFMRPEPVDTEWVMIVAAGGIIVNGFAGYLLAREGGDDLNIRAAVAHLLADAAVSMGVVAGALLIKLTGALWIDPLLSLFINVAIIVGTWGVLRESLAMSLAAVPRTVEADEVRRYLTSLPGVTGLHDLHIWSVSTRETALTAHLVMPQGHPGDAFLMDACETLRRDHRIGHATLQIETSLQTVCALAPDDVV